jgi:hypothetical protein
MNNLSVVLVSYRRITRLEMILEAWLKETPDVWLADCTGGAFTTALPIHRVQFSPDPGNRARHALALLTAGEYVIKADDDFLPHPGFVKDALEAEAACVIETGGPGIVGVIGRRFNGPRYYEDTAFFRSNDIPWPTRVDFVGVCTMSPRAFLPFDLLGCHSAIEDLFWQLKAFRDIPKYLIKSQNYENLPETQDKGRLFKDPAAREIRETFYRAVWAQK